MQKSQTFSALNGLRFLAALAVVTFHYAPRVLHYGELPAALKNLINEGPCAVGFFFILSGFVLGYRYLRAGARVEGTAEFYWARFARIYPAYFLAFLLFLPVAVQRYALNGPTESAGRHTFLSSAALSGLMLQSWTPLAQTWNGPSWSLSVEAFLYLLFPLIGYRVARLGRRRNALVLLASWLVPSSLALAYVAGWIPQRTWQDYITNNPLLWLPLFVMGICASRWVSAWQRVPERRAERLATAAFITVILTSLVWPHQWADVLVTGGIAPLLVALIVFFTRRSNWIARALGGAAFNKMGEASYAIYILQAPLWHYWQPLTNYLRQEPLQTNVVALWQFSGFLGFLIGCALAVHRFIELPTREWLNAWKKAGFRFAARRTQSGSRAILRGQVAEQI